MLGLSVTALVAGSAMAAASRRSPSPRGLENLAGGLIVCGLWLLGMELPLFR